MTRLYLTAFILSGKMLDKLKESPTSEPLGAPANERIFSQVVDSFFIFAHFYFYMLT